MTSIDNHFDQLSPLVDGVINSIGALKLCPFKDATLTVWAMSRIALGRAIEMANSNYDDEQISPEERQHLMEMLEDNMRQSNAAMMAVLERHGAILQ